MLLAVAGKWCRARHPRSRATDRRAKTYAHTYSATDADARQARWSGRRAYRTGRTVATVGRNLRHNTLEERVRLGVPVGEGKTAGPMGTACQWDGNSAGDNAVYAQIQLINDPHYWEKHTGAKGYEALQGIGKEAFVATSLGGWEAGTVTDKAAVFISLNGDSSSRDSAVKFLRSTLERLG